MNNRGKTLINLVLSQNNERLNNADKELSGITHKRKSLNRELDQNNEKLNNADKENQLSSINLNKDAYSLIVLNGNSCHVENIEDFVELEDLLSKTIQDDITQIPSNLDTLNAHNIKTNALAVTDQEFTAYPCTAIDYFTDPVIATNSTATLTNCTTISTICTATATDFATAATLLNATNVSRVACHSSTESTFPETTDIYTKRADNEPNLEQNLFYHVPSPLHTLNALNIEANALEATDFELTADPWTVAINVSTESVIAINSTTISTTCTATATSCATTTTLSNAINISPHATSNNSTESTFLETTDDTQTAENEPNPEQIEAFSDPNNHNMDEGRKRRKTADSKNWKRNLNKKLRMEGKSYTGFRTDDSKKIHQDTPRENRKIKPTCTKEKCIRSKTKKCSKFSQTQRTAIFEKFWSSERFLETREARKNPCPYEAFDLDYNFFKDYTQPLRYKSIRPGRNKNDPTVMDIKVIAYCPDGMIKVKLDFDGDYVMLPNRPARHVAPVQIYPPLYTERCKITKSKWLRLQELKSVIPSDCHQFYDNLPYKE